MKKLLALLTVVALGGVAWASVYEDQVRDRLKPFGNVCVAGEECATATVAASGSGSGEPMSGSDVYASACAACHTSGALNAPRLVAADWADRREKGAEALYSNAINGIGAMPAKGGNASLSDDEVIAAVDYMLGEAQ
ncbi:MAG: c-type cytochrome [Saccharospirillum sp.]